MRRKVFDMLASAGGIVVAVVLVVAGALAMWGYSFANSSVHSQLARQEIYFPPASAFAHPKVGTEITPSMIPSVSQYAGQQLLTGPQAAVYANDFIAVHLKEIGGGKTYSELSAEARALPPGSAAQKAAEATVQTVFQGTTLRGLLLNAYGWWQVGQVALWAGIVSFAMAALTLILSGLGLWHSRRVPLDAEIPELRTAQPSLTQGVAV